VVFEKLAEICPQNSSNLAVNLPQAFGKRLYKNSTKRQIIWSFHFFCQDLHMMNKELRASAIVCVKFGIS
jgi:hypothetical protein